jgi:CDP-4-dehydro-6-deoxyglucose reductase, E1
VRALEAEWSEWLGVKYSVFVNSGASVNLLTMSILKVLHSAGGGSIVTRTLAMAPKNILAKINEKTRSAFLAHVQGFDVLTGGLLGELKQCNTFY